MPKAKKHKLKLEPDYDFTIIAIVASEPVYKLSWNLNQNPEFDFKQGDSVMLSENCQIARYKHIESDNVLYELVQNKSDCGYLLPSHKNLDFFLIVRQQVDQDRINTLLKQLKDTKLVLGAYIIENLSKSKQKSFIWD